MCLYRKKMNGFSECFTLGFTLGCCHCVTYQQKVHNLPMQLDKKLAEMLTKDT